MLNDIKEFLDPLDSRYALDFGPLHFHRTRFIWSIMFGNVFKISLTPFYDPMPNAPKFAPRVDFTTYQGPLHISREVSIHLDKSKRENRFYASDDKKFWRLDIDKLITVFYVRA